MTKRLMSSNDRCKAYVKLGDGLEYQLLARLTVEDTFDGEPEWGNRDGAAVRMVTLSGVKLRLSAGRFALAAQQAARANQDVRVTVMQDGATVGIGNHEMRVADVNPSAEGGLQIKFVGMVYFRGVSANA